ncbi:MAG: NHLP leader peptide family RiPP precursor [Chloroflexota bacterium]
MSEEVPPLRRELENHLIGRALRDDAFRQRLMSDPKGAIQVELDRLKLGIELPERLQVKLLEERPDTLYLILPPSLIAANPWSDEALLSMVQGLMGERPDAAGGRRAEADSGGPVSGAGPEP